MILIGIAFRPLVRVDHIFEREGMKVEGCPDPFHEANVGEARAIKPDDGPFRAQSESLVEIDAVGQTTIEIIPFTPIRQVRVLKGRHAELLLADRSDDFIKAVLTDDAPVIDGMKRIRDVFPNACELIYERDEQAQEVKSLTGRALAVANPVEVIGDFVEHVRDEGFSEKELEVVASALGRLCEAEDVQ